MSNILWKSLVVSPAVLGATLLVSTTVMAAQNPTKSEVVIPTEVSSVEDNQASIQVSTIATTKAQLSETSAQEQPVKIQESTHASTIATTTPTKEAHSSQTLAQAKPQVNVLEQVNNYGNEGKGNSLSQVTSVSQFSDVQPTDWAFQALQSLVERYGCIAGYPNGTYRGNRALTRY